MECTSAPLPVGGKVTSPLVIRGGSGAQSGTVTNKTFMSVVLQFIKVMHSLHSGALPSQVLFDLQIRMVCPTRV